MKQMQSVAVNEGRRAALMGQMSSYGSLFTLQPLEFDATPAIPLRYLFVKRAIDLLFSLVMIPTFLLPGLVIAAAIVLTSKGPVFYREERIGRNGRRFRIWKFRSMYSDANEQSRIAAVESTGKVLHWRMRKDLRDPRITAVGNFLRVWSLDEIPQFLNVLSGDMSLIGPRPIVPDEQHLYGDLMDYYLRVKPGLSGLWQVSGRSNVDYARRAELDAKYVRTWSPQRDFWVLFRTISVVLRREGAS
jgi:lipopolysaccharide/colanic/teichoic acid biosynthesis glycosyltransferase